MVINHNMSAMFAQRSQGIQDLNQQKSMEKLSSGMRINRAGDDASGLAVSEKMRAQIRGLNQASTNAQNGISFIQTTEGYLQETTDIVQRIRELAVQSSNGIYSSEDRMQIQVEVSSLIAEVDRIASCAQFNGMNMLTGRFARPTGENVVTGSMWFHIGANMDQRTQVYIGTMSAMALGLRNVGETSSVIESCITSTFQGNLGQICDCILAEHDFQQVFSLRRNNELNVEVTKLRCGRPVASKTDNLIVVDGRVIHCRL